MPGSRTKFYLLLATLILAVLGSKQLHAGNCSQADAEALGWLEKMSRSLHEVSYHGTVTLESGDEQHVMQVAHIVKDGVSQESMARLNGQNVKVVRHDHPLECVHPGHKLLRIGDEFRQGNCGVADQYRFRVVAGERIAGRSTVEIQILPRDVYRYGYRIALDRSNGLLLKSETIGQDGSVLERFQFASLSYSDELPGVTESQTVLQAQHPDVDRIPSILVQREWRVQWIPSGFMPTDNTHAHSGRRSFTDGLAVFSVFVEYLDKHMKPGEGRYRQGGTTGYTRGLAIEGEPVLVTVVGEVPINTLRVVADSVEWVD